MSTTRPAPLERRVEPETWAEGVYYSGPRHEYRESLLLRRLEEGLSGRRILDAGCGGGTMTEMLCQADFRVTALDFSREFIQQLERRLRGSRLRSQPETVVGDLLEMPFADRTFDGIVCGEVLEHLDDDAAAVAEIARVLTPGGVLVVSVPAGPWRYDWVDHWAGHLRRYTQQGMAELLADAGLERIEVVPWGFPLSGLFHRRVYRPLLRRRLERGSSESSAREGAPPALAQRVVRLALELDTLFLGRRPGYHGLIASAHRPR